MKSIIFVYGTLMKNMQNNYYLEDSEYLGICEIEGYEMFNLGSYPGIIHGKGKIKGEMYQVDENTLDRINHLEGEGYLYNKEIVPTIYGNAYVYVYNLSIDGCESIPYEMQPYNELVYYVSYGSNLLEERFLNYIQGGKCRYNGNDYSPCRNSHKPIKSVKYEIPYDIYFSKNSPSWNDSPVCFLDVSHEGFSYGRAYLITKEQFDDIQIKEGPSWYGKIVNLGKLNGFDCYTFTNVKNLEHKRIEDVSEPYLNVIKDGLKETYNFSDEKIHKYLYSNEN